jgi:membrane protein implicated in regulation of membrane protease activity
MLLEIFFALFFIASLFFIIPFVLMIEFFLFFVILGLGALASVAVLFGREWSIQIIFLVSCLIAAHYFIKRLFNRKKMEKF